jgi:hypothetical protein
LHITGAADVRDEHEKEPGLPLIWYRTPPCFAQGTLL